MWYTVLVEVHELQAMIDAGGLAVGLHDLEPWDRNPRHNTEAAKALAPAILDLGWGAPVVYQSSSGRIIAGHTRWKAAHILGLERVPAYGMDVDDRVAAKVALGDNRLGELASWDNQALIQVIEEEGLGLPELELIGFDREYLEGLEDLGPLPPDDENDSGLFSLKVEVNTSAEIDELKRLCEQYGWSYR